MTCIPSVAALWIVIAPLLAQDSPKVTAVAPASQPTARSTAPDTHGPAEDPILRELLRERDRTPPPIQPVRIGAKAGQPVELQPVANLGDGTLILEGETLFSRPGRLVRDGDQARFIFHAGKDEAMRYEMPINPSSLLELMEREAERGVTDFEVTADVKLYRGKNYLDLRKVVRRVPNNNVAP